MKNLSLQLAEETKLENTYEKVGTTVTIDNLLPSGITHNRYTKVYFDFAKTHPTPELLLGAEEQSHKFIRERGYVDDEATGAAMWVLWKIWAKKLEAKAIYSPGLLEKVAQAKATRDQKVALHQAVNKLAKDAKPDSFAEGLKANVFSLLDDAGARELAGYLAPEEGAVQTLLGETNA